MKIFHEQVEQSSFTEINLPKDFTSEELIYLKTIFMLIEKAIDEIELTDKKSKTFPGSFIFTILEKAQVMIVEFIYINKKNMYSLVYIYFKYFLDHSY